MVYVGNLFFLVVGESNVGRGFEELFPELWVEFKVSMIDQLEKENVDSCARVYLGERGLSYLRSFPNGFGFFCVPLDYGDDRCCDYPVRFAEVMVDFCYIVSY